MAVSLYRSYDRMYPQKPKPGDQVQADDNCDGTENAELLHRGRVCTVISILTYIAAGMFLVVQEVHESPLIVDHLVYVFLILSYSFCFAALRFIGTEYFLSFVSKYCDQERVNNEKRAEYTKLFKGIYNAYGAFSAIYWLGYLVAVCTNKNNFVVTAIGLGHIYLATITLLHVK